MKTNNNAFGSIPFNNNCTGYKNYPFLWHFCVSSLWSLKHPIFTIDMGKKLLIKPSQLNSDLDFLLNLSLYDCQTVKVQ